MRDKSPVKIICRIINLILYTATAFSIYLMQPLLTEAPPEKVIEIMDNKTMVIIICAIPLLIMMILSLILKYKLEEGARVNPYRIIDTITRIIVTIPITFVICYYIFVNIANSVIVNTILGLIVFFGLDRIIILTLQETLSVTFIIHDEL